MALPRGRRGDVADLGKVLSGLLASPSSYQALDACKATSGSTWTSGGCLALALGLQGWAGTAASLAGISGRGRGQGFPAIDDPLLLVQHVLVAVEHGYLDADGFSSGNGLLARWRAEEGIWDASILRLDAGDVATILGQGELVAPAILVGWVESTCRRELGHPRDWGLS